MSELTKEDITYLLELCDGATDLPGPWGSFRRKVRSKLVAMRDGVRLGAQVFELRLAIGNSETKKIRKGVPASAWAPTLNEYAALKPWQLKQLREAVDWRILEACTSWRRWSMGIVRAPGHGKTGRVLDEGQSRKRIAVVTRYGRRKMDEVSCDSIGGKIPIDRFVRFGILRDDSDRWCQRIARYEPCAEGNEHVLFQVHELVK